MFHAMFQDLLYIPCYISGFALYSALYPELVKDHETGIAFKEYLRNRFKHIHWHHLHSMIVI